MAPRGSSYISEGGILSRESSSRKTPLWKFVEWNRVAILSVLAVALYATNPSNGILPVYFTFPEENSFTFGRPSVTNYGFFSVECTLEGIGLSGLLSRYDGMCPFYGQTHSEVGVFCGNLADTVCHQKPLFLWHYPPVQHFFQKVTKYGFYSQDFLDAWNDLLSALSIDRVYVCHRVLCFLLIGSTVWAFCCPRFPSVSALFGMTDLWTSVFSRSSTTNLFRDLLYQNSFVYPALVELDRMVPKLRRTSWLVRPTGNETTDYLVAVLLLVVVLGGGANLLASKIVGSRARGKVAGFSAVGAVGLGYLIRSSNNDPRFLTFFFRRGILYVHAFWTNAVWIVFFGGNPNHWYSRLVSWLLAGLVGCLYAEFHQKHVDVLGLADLWSYFGF